MFREGQEENPSLAALSARDVAVIIPARDTRELVLACLQSLQDTDLGRVVVVDDGSADDTVHAVLERFPTVEILSSSVSRGFAVSVNAGAKRAEGARVLLFLNSDTELLPHSIEHLMEAFEREPELGIAGARLFYPDGRPQWSGGGAPSLLWLLGVASGLPRLLGRLPLYRKLRPVRGFEGGRVAWVTGAAMAVRDEAWAEAGPFDESFDFYCQDLDLCLRAAEAGWKVATVAGFEVLHHHGATIGRREVGGEGAAPELLWADLLRWAEEHRGAGWARRARTVLRAGARLRVAARSAVWPFLVGERRRTHRAGTRILRRALRRLDEVPVEGGRGC